jgi:2-dehydro-3-deoxygluconokinase
VELVMRVVVLGEGMLELSQHGGGWQLGYGGDTLNTAIHLSRLGDDVAFVTALGSDPFSEELRAGWASEGLDLGLILTDPTRQPGLYAIRTDPQGERSFSYWRNDSAARGLFALDGVEAVLAAAEQADLFCYSLITLAILPPAAREALFAVCARVRRRGGRVAFDGNFRTRLWASLDEARSARDAAIACADIGLPTLEDEIALSGAEDADAVAAHWNRLGAAETIVKLGAEGCRLPDGRIVAPPARLEPVDTSGAGDAFNAGYLHARLAGAGLEDAALAGHRLAGWVITRPGAIPAPTSEAPYPGV